jgi:hypothetical protein
MSQDTKLNSYKNAQLATQTNKISYLTQGIFESADYTDINSVAVSHNKQYLILGNDNGHVQMTNFPCVNPRQKRTTYKGHSSHVTKVRWGP